MGSQMDEFEPSLKALWANARNGTYHDTMAISQVLPALQKQSYLHLKSKDCRSEDGAYSTSTYSFILKCFSTKLNTLSVKLQPRKHSTVITKYIWKIISVS